MSKHIELLAPAGDLFRGTIALDYGADAIYFGAKQYSLRARASNFDFNEIKKMINYAHKQYKKVYIVTNILCHNTQMLNFNNFIKKILKLKPDGFICADPYIISQINKINPNVDIHVSTQQSVTNSKAALFWKRNHAKRIVLAREVSFNELKQLLKNIKNQIEIEYFIHGAVCIGYSGRCLLSNNYCLRDANIGGCAQSCRWTYTLFDDKKVYSKNFSMSPKDMNQMINLEKLLCLNLSSLKIEGRMKTEHYLATVCKNYKQAINDYYSNHKIKDIKFYLSELNKVDNREVKQAWFNGLPGLSSMLSNKSQSIVNQSYVFIINKKINDNKYEITSKNYFTKNQLFESIGSEHDLIKFKITKIIDKNKTALSIVNTPQKVFIITTNKPLNLAKKWYRENI